MYDNISVLPFYSQPPLYTPDMLVPLTCVASVTEASCRYSEFPHPYSCPSLDTARLQSPYVLICCTSTPARSPPTSTGLELMLWCPRPGRRGAGMIKLRKPPSHLLLLTNLRMKAEGSLKYCVYQQQHFFPAPVWFSVCFPGLYCKGLRDYN